MIETLRALRKKLVIGFVGGSDLKKIREQLQTGTEDGMDVLFLRRIGANLSRGSVIHEFDYSFAENGLTAYKLGKELPSHSFIGFLGEDRYKLLIKFVLHYLADMDIPIKRCTTILSSLIYVLLGFEQGHICGIPQWNGEHQSDWPQCKVYSKPPCMRFKLQMIIQHPREKRFRGS
jgi:hypothetical protein